MLIITRYRDCQLYSSNASSFLILPAFVTHPLLPVVRAVSLSSDHLTFPRMKKKISG
jgi:hypothetical protein